MKPAKLFVIVLHLMLWIPFFAAHAKQPPAIPPELENWKAWVLHDQEERLCPFDTNNGATARCQWPSRLVLRVSAEGGTFEQDWIMFAEQVVALPGEADIWPDDVQTDGRPAVVLSRDGAPATFLPPGQHRVSGAFRWREMPEMIRVPASSGLVELFIDDQRIDRPVMDREGRLWLQKRAGVQAEEDTLDVRVFRLITDEIPMKVTSLLRLTISGRARELRLDGIVPDTARPMLLESTLPARLGPEGTLMLQARPGQWEVRLSAYFPEPMYSLGPIKALHGEEIWAFQAMNHLRMVKIDGAPSIEPRRTDLPEKWKQYPAYLMGPEATLRIEELRRGDPEPAPDRLSLSRNLWLDFDGQGYTIQDSVSGVMSQKWQLSMNPPANLGRVAVNGEDQLIVSTSGDGKPGVELRQGDLNLTADSRIEASLRELPAVGWDHDFQSVSASLNLPPGWRLFTVSGVDKVSDTWFQRWTLLDLFIVLIIAVGTIKLRHPVWGGLVLVALGLCYHEPGAPRLVWLHILAALALLRVLGPGWARRLVRVWAAGAVIVLMVLVIPFMVTQVRVGMYPQLEDVGYSGGSGFTAFFSQKKVVPMSGTLAPEAENMQMQSSKSRAFDGKIDAPKSQKQAALMGHDPNALIQTGPGLPSWNWRRISLSWSGPVEKGQHIRFWLLSPGVNFFLGILRVLLIGAMILAVLDPWDYLKGLAAKTTGRSAAGLALAFFFLLITAGAKAQAEYPPEILLNQLKERLLEKPDCLPDCASCDRLDLDVGPDHLRLLLEIHAQAEIAVPLPGAVNSWLPREVLVNQSPARGLLRDTDGRLWLLVPSGIHNVLLLGPVGPVNEVGLSLPLKPRRASFTAQGWEVTGIDKDGRVAPGLQLTRLKTGNDPVAELGGTSLPAFFQVTRELHLGLNWQVQTTLTRLTRTGTPVSAAIPLLAGEAVTTAGLHVENGRVLASLDPQTRGVSWASTLTPAAEIHLTAPREVAWTETWILDASPIWHCEPKGIAVIHHQDDTGLWRPQWRPWPGEGVVISVSRPTAVAGRKLTIDSVNLEYTPGQRTDKAKLALQLRASQGVRHPITLPAGAVLQSVTLNNASQPICLENSRIVVPVSPGSSKIEVEWQTPAASARIIRGPEVNAGDAAVNIDVTYRIPDNRWVLFAFGPRLGPAVLFWSYLVIVVLAALVLGRTQLAPLKTWQWVLLGVGLTQVNALIALIVVGWLLVLGWRKQNPKLDWGFLRFNGLQLILVLWTVAALAGLYEAVEKGLLGIPQMQIRGNGSYHGLLHWTQDRIAGDLPRPLSLSLPMFVYRLLMLAWALWLAMSLLKWLRWGWECFSQGRLWRKADFGKRRSQQRTEPPPLKSA